MFIHTQQWDFLNSIYFCFVTLSTIGFGDFVPKNKNNQDIRNKVAIHNEWRAATD